MRGEGVGRVAHLWTPHLREAKVDSAAPQANLPSSLTATPHSDLRQARHGVRHAPYRMCVRKFIAIDICTATGLPSRIAVPIYTQPHRL